MSLHISLVTKDLKHDHPTWNDNKMAGDKFISVLLIALPCEHHKCDDETIISRPADFLKWREKLAMLPKDRSNPERFPQMLDLLEADPDYWIYISV